VTVLTLSKPDAEMEPEQWDPSRSHRPRQAALEVATCAEAGQRACRPHRNVAA
jgi:hypothetical protein